MSAETYPFTRRPTPAAEVHTTFRQIGTELPPAELCWVLGDLEATEPASMALDQPPVVWDRAQGFQVWDAAGNCWLDFSSGIFVANVGHAHPRVVSAIREMLEKPLLHNYYFPSEVRARLTGKLLELAGPPFDCVYLLTTGAEATECAIKLARMHGSSMDSRKLGIVTLTYGFHGKTMGAQMAGGRPEAKKWIGPLDPNFHQLPVPFCAKCPWGRSQYANCGKECFFQGLSQLEQNGVDLESIAAFMFEPYQGWSGAFLPADYVQAMRQWATEHSALLVSDEIQAGFGRTGKLFGYQHFEVDVDLVCCGKGMSSSLPISAVLGTRKLIDIDGSLNSTHSGNPVCCAAALANLEVLEGEQLIEHAGELGRFIEPRLRALQARFPERVGVVSGAGAVWGILLTDPQSGGWDVAAADAVVEQAMRRGLLLIRTGVGSIKLGPPLSTPCDAVSEGLDILEESVSACFAADR